MIRFVITQTKDNSNDRKPDMLYRLLFVSRALLVGEDVYISRQVVWSLLGANFVLRNWNQVIPLLVLISDYFPSPFSIAFVILRFSRLAALKLILLIKHPTLWRPRWKATILCSQFASFANRNCFSSSSFSSSVWIKFCHLITINSSPPTDSPFPTLCFIPLGGLCSIKRNRVWFATTNRISQCDFLFGQWERKTVEWLRVCGP